MNNETGLIKDLIKDFEYLIQDIKDPLGKPWLMTAISANLASMNKDMPRECIDKVVKVIYLMDNA